MAARRTTGFVLGKFMPLHRGHEGLLRFAENNCDDLMVVVDNIPDAWVGWQLRCRWVAQTVPRARVFHLPAPLPQDPSEHPRFWDIWRGALQDLLPARPDYVFASEPYGQRLAQELGAAFIPFDIPRAAVPVSGTQLRAGLRRHWHLLSEAAKRDYCLRVTVEDEEMARHLARHFLAVPQEAGMVVFSGGTERADFELPAGMDLAQAIARVDQALENFFADPRRHRPDGIIPAPGA